MFPLLFQSRLIEKVYGKCLAKNRANNAESQIIESADILKLQQEQRKNSINEESRRSSLSNSQITPKKSIFNGMEMSNSPFKVLKKLQFHFSVHQVVDSKCVLLSILNIC